MEVYIVVLFWRLFQLCCNIIAEHDFTIVPLYTCTPWTIYGGARTGNDMETTSNDISTTTQRNRSSHTLTQEHYELSTTLRDLGPAPSLDLSLYPYYKPPGHIEHFSELDVAPPCCLNQYNPCISMPNHLDQTHEHTKIYLSAVSNPDNFSKWKFYTVGISPTIFLKKQAKF
jgi:hypothetical protein